MIGIIMKSGYILNLSVIVDGNKLFTMAITIEIPSKPLNKPKIIPILPTTNASKNTVFLICALVAPILEKRPNCFLRSMTEIANEL